MLQTDRLFLKLPALSDAPIMAEYLNRADTALMMLTVPLPYTLKDAQHFIAKIHDSTTPNPHYFNIYGQHDATLMGAIGINERTNRNDNGQTEYELGYWLGHPHWGNSYIVEAAIVVIDNFFKKNPNANIYVSHAIKNTQSKRVIEKLGFTYIYDYEIYVSMRDEHMKSKRYKLSKSEWLNL